MSFKFSVSKVASLAGLSLLVMFGQNCSNVDFSAAESPSEKAFSDDIAADDGENIDEGDGVVHSDDPKEWLMANCDANELKKASSSFDYQPQGSSVSQMQNQVSNLNIADAPNVRLQQMSVGSLKIEKSGTVELQQIHAGSIFVEALNIQKFQQLFAQELWIKTALISNGNLQQIGTGNSKLRVEANRVEGAVQQVSALCLATNSVETVQQVRYAHIVGRSSPSGVAQIGKIQQLKEVIVEDADVGSIQQVSEITLKNTHVDRILQAGKVILINSTYGEISQVGEVIQK